MWDAFLAIALTTTVAEAPVFVLPGIGGECPKHIEIVNSPVTLHSMASVHSPVVETRAIDVPHPIPAIGARTVTLRAGELVMRKNAVVDAVCLGNVDSLLGPAPRTECNSLLLNQGERLQYLAYLAEGFCLVRLDDMVLESQLCAQLFDDDSAFELVSMPETQIWLNLGEADSERWLLLDEHNVKLTCEKPDAESAKPATQE